MGAWANNSNGKLMPDKEYYLTFKYRSGDPELILSTASTVDLDTGLSADGEDYSLKYSTIAKNKTYNPDKKYHPIVIKAEYINKNHEHNNTYVDTMFISEIKFGDVDITKDIVYQEKNTFCFINSPMNAIDVTSDVKEVPRSDTTTDPASGSTVPANDKNTTSNTTSNNPSTEPTTAAEETDGEEDTSEFDENFLKVYSYYGLDDDHTVNTYKNGLEQGLRVKNLRGILGMPHQFLPLTDPRINSTGNIGEDDMFGRVYAERIIKHIPLLLMTPGVPQFMASYNKNQREGIIGALMGLITDNDALNDLFDGKQGKYYSLKYMYTEYFYYVNAMLRSAAYFLGIDSETIDDKKLGTLNWLYQSATGLGSDIFNSNALDKFLGPYTGAIAFYADAGTSVDESISNSTTESSLASLFDGLSDKGREINFIVGSATGEIGLNFDMLTGEGYDNTIQSLTATVTDLFGGQQNALSRIIGKAGTLLAGGKLIFPELWSDSSFSRSYSCNMKLVASSGSKLSVYLDILVPIYHLLGFTVPRESATAQQAFISPFLVRAYYKGLFNVDMGLITNLSITKGEEGEWTVDGIPTVANVSFDIKDLYDDLYISKQTKEDGFHSIMSNIQELDYIANSCGINVNDQEVMRTLKMYAMLTISGVTDKITIGIFGKTSQFFTQKFNDIFGKF